MSDRYLTSRYSNLINIANSNHLIAFRNDYVQYNKLRYFDRNKELKYTLLSNAENSLGRFLCYKQTFSNNDIKHKGKAVLYLDNKNTASVIFETINASASRFESSHGANLSFWTNLKNKETFLKEGENPYYEYDASKVLKIDQSKLDDFLIDSNAVYRRVFCQTFINFEIMYVLNDGENIEGVNELEYVPVITKKPVVLLEIADNSLILDFAANSKGGGGGLKQHMHIPNVDPQSSNFSAAVFMPGSGAPAYPWKI